MLSLSNLNDKYIKVDANYIKNMVNDGDNYTHLKITTNLNCCKEVNTRIINFDSTNYVSCSACNGANSWHIDLSEIIYNNYNIDSLVIKNIVSGVEFNILSSPIDFNYYTSNCPSNVCTLQSLSPYYEQLFENRFDSWFSSGTMWQDTTVGLCENILTICELPENFIVKEITFNGTSLPFKYSANTSSDSDVFADSEGNLYISSELFGLDKFKDGIYKIKVRTEKKDDTWTEDEGCIFIDIDTKCKVAKKIEDILKKDEDATDIHMAHYALINGSNCGCNCNDLCELFKYINKVLGNPIETTNSDDCDC